jgi:hypothetical protein
MKKILKIVKNHFEKISLLTINPAVALLYDSFGFVKTSKGINLSHILSLNRS